MNLSLRATLSTLFLCLLWSVSATAGETIEERIVRDRVGTYAELTKRLRDKGPNASFPEFKPVVDRLIADLKADWFLEAIKKEPMLKMELEEVQTMLFHVNITFSYEDQAVYPYATPFEGIFPYRPTIDAIEKAVGLFDKVDRILNPGEAVPLYHFDRYAYHRHNMMADPRVVIIPTLSSLGFNELIQVRSVPIGFIGVSTRGLRVDRHYQSPLDFWYHDLNHVRRMVQYIFQMLRQLKNYTFEEEIAFYRSMDDFIENTLMPHLQKIPLSADRKKYAERAMLRVLVFEILHESALPATRQWIIDDLLRRPGTTQPFEVMLEQAPILGFDNETRRTNTGNLVSGSRQYRESAGQTVNVHFIHDRALSLLGNLYNKLLYGFFDDPEDPKNYVVPVEHRTPTAVLTAAKQLFKILDYHTLPDDETLLGWITSKGGSPEKFTYESIRRAQDEEGLVTKTGPKSVSEILDRDGAIAHAAKIKGDKRIVTFMGNSANGYEHPHVVDEILIEKLRSMDPKTDIVNCGGTKEGISRVYSLAQAMGFETMGVASTQSLSYSGRFAPCVDHHILVGDSQWGGRTASGELTPVTDVFVTISDEIFAVGGGQNTAVTIQAAEERGKRVSYRAAEMDHEAARREALYRKKPAPSTYEGVAFHQWMQIAEQRVKRMKQTLGCSDLVEAAAD